MLYVSAGGKQQTGLEVIVNDSLVYSILDFEHNKLAMNTPVF